MNTLEKMALQKHLVEQANAGKITMNQAFKNWQTNAEPYSNSDGEKTSFADWLRRANEEGWVDKGTSILSGLLGRNKGGQETIVVQEKTNYTPLFVTIGVSAVVIIGLAYYLSKNKK
jgi:hypothetical protein